MKALKSILLSLSLAFTLHPVFADVSLPTIFSDGIVLQRDTMAPFWGKAAPNETVTLALNGQTISTKADSDGNWQAAFRGLAVGGPFSLTIKGATNSITLNNVLVGDVWLCSGQSNMTLHMGEIADVAKDDIAAAKDPLLHCFTVPYAISNAPVNFPGAGKWDATDPSTVTGYSAVAYYFAKELRAQVKVPIGIIHCAYGGTSGEAWMRKEWLDGMDNAVETDATTQSWNCADDTAKKFFADLNAWETKMGRQDPGNKGFAQGWADPKTDVSTWAYTVTPGDWSSLGLANGGVVWMRKAVTLSASDAGKDFTLELGNLQNAGHEFGNVIGTVYFNNHEVGTIGDSLRRMFSKPDDQEVKIPGSLVNAGSNLVAIRVFTQVQKGPLFGGGTRMLGAPLTARVGAGWQVKVEAELPAAPAGAESTRPTTPQVPKLVSVPSLFYNGMLCPLVGYGIKGTVWYQGEANADRGTAYGKLLTALITNWRTAWKQGEFPFYIVQIANSFAASDDPNNKTGFATIRESQLQTWKSVPNTGMAVAIDVGDPANIHYHNKKPVGQRLALIALAQTYGQKIEFSGPVYDSMAVQGKAIRLKFTHLGSGLVAKNGPLKRFAIAGADRKYVWADAVIDGDTVVVSSSQINAPMAVRYAWADNPAGCNLYNKDDLPASPFCTDPWPPVNP